ncbi:helix-turn-helix domain-containing protein [Vibrio sp. HN007]|uniref:helix-turn-helix domain-containing protein n=1 Tax=Vibrio iocasae TaxID=3098914 RepID=UPI0035D444E1
MTTTFSLEPHLRHPHIRFALIWGDHAEDFPPHKHDFAELFVVTGGTAIHSVGQFHYPIHTGDVFVIHGDTEHAFNKVNNLELTNLMYDHASPIFESPELRLIPGYQALFNIDPIARQKSDYSAKLNLDPEQTEVILSLLKNIEDEYVNAPPGFETMLKAQLSQFVVTLSRYYQGESTKTNSSTLVLSRAMVFMEQQFSNSELKTEEIASSAFISVRQLERLFKSYLQTSPNQYLRNIRINYAEKLLLSEENRSIQSVADKSGFTDSNYFAKCFKERNGISPRAFRKNYSENVPAKG